MDLSWSRTLLLLCLAVCLCHTTLSTEDVVEEVIPGNLVDESIRSLQDAEGQSESDAASPPDQGPDDGSAAVEQDSAVPPADPVVIELTGVAEDEQLSNVSGDGVSQANATELATDETGKNSSKSGRTTKVKCSPNNSTEEVEFVVQILNGSALPNSFQTTPNLTVANCVLTLFYVPWCHFSTAAARNYNALPRLYPDINCFAVNSATYSSLNARYGTVAVPTLLLFHNGQPVAKFNDTQYSLEKFVEFIRKNTGLEPVGEVKLTSADIKGPLPGSPVEETDYLLWLAWIFFISCCCYGFTRSVLWHCMVETLRNNWQEAEAQHEHAD